MRMDYRTTLPGDVIQQVALVPLVTRCTFMMSHLVFHGYVIVTHT